MPDPGDAELAFPDFRKERARLAPGSLCEKRRNQDFGQEITFPPIAAWPQPDAGGTFRPGAVSARLANDISAAFFRKTNRHFERTIWIERVESKMFWGTHELKQEVRNQQSEIRGRRRTPAVTACPQRSRTGSIILPLQIIRDLGELGQGGLPSSPRLRRGTRRFFDNKDRVIRGELRRTGTAIKAAATYRRWL